MENKCVWTYVKLVNGGHYAIECGKEDNLTYYTGFADSKSEMNKSYYRFEYCPFCGKEIERK